VTEPQPRRARHLMDPNAPRRTAEEQQQEQTSLTRVQRWVMSVLAVTTLFHLQVGLIVAALYLDDPRPGAQVGLCVIAGAFGLMSVALAFLTHGRKPYTPWLVVGLVPAAVGIWLVTR
jgi:hypothetical protein